MTPTPDQKAAEIVYDIMQTCTDLSLIDAKKIAIMLVNNILKCEPMEPKDCTDIYLYYEAVKAGISKI